jgi:polyisoprenoid-binding protein YceI
MMAGRRLQIQHYLCAPRRAFAGKTRKQRETRKYSSARCWLTRTSIVLPLLASPAAAAPALYHIDQRYGTIEFSVSSLGLFTTEGRFSRFQGDLLLDPEHPERTHVDVTIDANSVEMPLPNEVVMLRSAAYFDITRYPFEHFVSTAIEPLAPDRYRVLGKLQLRGVTEPIALDAVLKNKHFDRARGVEVADFKVSGQLRRSEFGMRANSFMVSDVVRLKIRLHLTVPAAPQSG